MPSRTIINAVARDLADAARRTAALVVVDVDDAGYAQWLDACEAVDVAADHAHEIGVESVIDALRAALDDCHPVALLTAGNLAARQADQLERLAG